MKKSKIAFIKCRTLELRSKRQIPLILAKLISELTGKEDTKYLEYLIEMSEHFLRVPNYYKKYPQEEKHAEDVVLYGLKSLGF